MNMSGAAVSAERSDKAPVNMLIRRGRIIDPSQKMDVTGDIFISGGKIDRTGTGFTRALPDDCAVVDAEGMIICPGFIDLHCHLRQPGFEDKETIATGTRAAARGGFTTVCCMPNTQPPVDTKAVVEYIRRVAASEGAIHVLPLGCITRGRAGSELADLGELSVCGVVAFSDDGSPVADYALMREALLYSRESGLPIVEHCEDLDISRGGVMNDGELAKKMELKGIPAAAEEKAVARNIELARATGGRLHIAHVSTAGSVELIRCARREGVPVTAEVTPHHLTLTEEAVTGYNTAAKVNPPLRTAGDVAALVAGLNEDVIDVIATDHAPHTVEDKRCDFDHAAFGISGFETALGSLMGMVHRGEIALTTLISKLTYEPALFLRRSDLGTLKPGAAADVVIIDPEAEWKVDPAEFASRGRNTPLAGHILSGRVVLTLFRGVTVHSDSIIRVDYTGGTAGE